MNNESILANYIKKQKAKNEFVKELKKMDVLKMKSLDIERDSSGTDYKELTITIKYY